MSNENSKKVELNQAKTELVGFVESFKMDPPQPLPLLPPTTQMGLGWMGWFLPYEGE